MLTLIAVAILFLVLFAIGAFLVRAYNSIVMLRNNVEKAFANIDVVLKQRAEEVPNLAKVVQATALNENTILRELVALRSQYQQARGTNEKIHISEQLDARMKSFLLTVEGYPEITASQGFKALQQRLSQIEDKIAARREFFNDSVNNYNTGIQIFPNIVFATMFRYERQAMLQIPEAEKRYDGVLLGN